MNQRRHNRRPWLLALTLLFGSAALAQQSPSDEPPGGAPEEAAEAPAPVAPTPTPVTPSGPRADGPAAIRPMKSGEVLLNFQGADIQAVVKAVSQMTGRNFLMDPRVKGTVTIISSKPVSRANAYQIFLSALKAQGFTAVEGPGGLVRIVPTGEAKQGADVYPRLPVGEQITTHVAIVQHISAAQMVPLLRPLMAPTSQLSAYEPANALIITDYADNIRRLLKIIDKIDQPVSSDVTVVELEHASALDLADLITRLAAPPGAAPAAPGQPPQVPGDRFTIVPDLRTNTLLIRTDNPGRLNQLRSLIEKLDVPATTGGQTRVVYLRNAEAVKLAEVLRGLLAGEARAQTAAAPAAPGRPAARPASEASLIQADEATNALIINASDAVYNNLRAVIEKLDVRRAQVYVEALIAEVTTDKAMELGFQWFAAGEAGDGGAAGVTNFPSGRQGGIAQGIVNPASIIGSGGLSLAYLGPKIRLPDGTEVRGLGALATALESKNIANILSTPNIMTLDNAEAKIVVGQNVPFVTGNFALGTATTPSGGAINPFQTIERRDVGITLRIKPQISEGGGVKLEIFQEISTVTPAPAGITASDIITNKRSVETVVLVDDGSTVVLGGLIEDRNTDSRQQVPFLGRIPVLGSLFRYKSRDQNKTNLMIFLKPKIVRTADDGYRMTTDRYEYLRALSHEPDPHRAQVLERFRPTPPPAEPEKPAEEKHDPFSAPDGSPTVD